MEIAGNKILTIIVCHFYPVHLKLHPGFQSAVWGKHLRRGNENLTKELFRSMEDSVGLSSSSHSQFAHALF